MKTVWIVLPLCLAWSALAVNAQQPAAGSQNNDSIVIELDSQSEPQADTPPQMHGVVQTGDGNVVESDADAVKRLTKGGKLSPRERAAVARAAEADANVQSGNNFLAENKVRPGVVSLASGVQYKILRSGAGKRPGDQSTVLCRYLGKLTDGATFDKTDDRAGGAAMAVAGFLPGLREAVKLMPAGSKWEVVVPPQLAYGAHSNRGVGANAVLIYEIEILGVQ